MFDAQLRAPPSNRSALVGLLTNLSELFGITIWALLGFVAIGAVMEQLRRCLLLGGEPSPGPRSTPKVIQPAATEAMASMRR